MWRDEQASNSIFTTWQIFLDHRKCPSAACLLSLVSFFNRQNIPEMVICHYADIDLKEQDDLSSRRLEEEDVDFEEDLTVLRAFSLVGITQREGDAWPGPARDTDMAQVNRRRKETESRLYASDDPRAP